MTSLPEPCAWSRRRLWTFRTGISLFALQLVVMLSDTTNGARAAAASAQDAVRAAFAAVLPAGVDWIERFAARSDGHAVVLGLLRDAVLAIAIAASWTRCSRARQHDRLAAAMRVTLRYVVGVVMLIYGGLKVVPVQFPIPSAEELLRPLGERTPMALLWAFMGASPAYTVFAGLGEVVGGVLLFWRRTTTLGALLVAGVMANVAMLNFSYDVPVKRAAALLLLAAIVLLSRDAARLARVLVFDLPTDSDGEAPFAGATWLRRTRAVLKPTIVVLAVAGPISAAWVVGPPRWPRGPLDGVYEVERFVRDGAEVPPLRTDPTRWWRVVIGDRGGVVVQTTNGRCVRFGHTLDAGNGTLTLAAGDGRAPLRFRCQSAPGQPLRLVGEDTPIGEVVLRALPAERAFRVLH